MLFNGFRISIWQDEKFLEICCVNHVNLCNTTELYIVKNSKFYSLFLPEKNPKIFMRIITIPACDFAMRILSVNMCETLRAKRDILEVFEFLIYSVLAVGSALTL